MITRSQPAFSARLSSSSRSCSFIGLTMGKKIPSLFLRLPQVAKFLCESRSRPSTFSPASAAAALSDFTNIVLPTPPLLIEIVSFLMF